MYGGVRLGVVAFAAGLSLVASPGAGTAGAEQNGADHEATASSGRATATSARAPRVAPAGRAQRSVPRASVASMTAPPKRPSGGRVSGTTLNPVSEFLQGALLLLRRPTAPAVSPAIGIDFSTAYADPAPGYTQSVGVVSGQGITRVRMYDVIPDALSAIQTQIPTARVSVAVPNGSVSQLATDPSYAASVVSSLKPFASIVDAVVVGNEVDTAFVGDLPTVTAAVTNMQNAIAAAQLPVATTVSFTMGMVTGSYPPSNATLNPALSGLTGLLQALKDYVEIDIYPLLTLQQNPGIPLSYALGSPTCRKSNNCAVVDKVGDKDVVYHSLFWAEYDAVRWALNKANVSLPLYVGETGWATDSSGGVFPNANVANAQDYNQNLINSLLATGSPKFNQRGFPTHLFEFIDENQKTGGIFEQFWGLNAYSGGKISAKYTLNLTPSLSSRPRSGRVLVVGSGVAEATQVVPRNGWKAFEVIAAGANPGGDG